MKNQWDGSPKPEALVELRAAYGYTQTEAAELCRVTLRAWQWWEAGQRRMPVANWELLLIKAGLHHSYAPAGPDSALAAKPRGGQWF